MVRRGVIQRGFLLFALSLQLLFNPLCFQFEMLSFLLASACSELQTPLAAHAKECPSGVEGIIENALLLFKASVCIKSTSCEYLCMSVWSCSVPTGSCPNLVMSKHEVQEEKGGDVVSAALQPGCTHWSLCLVPSAGGDDCCNMLAPQDWQGALQVQVSLYGVVVPVPREQGGWVFGLVMCKVFRIRSVSKLCCGQGQLQAHVSLLVQLER